MAESTLDKIINQESLLKVLNNNIAGDSFSNSLACGSNDQVEYYIGPPLTLAF